MKRAVKVVFLACMLVGLVLGLASAQSQNKPKVAVYVTGGKNANENKVWGARMTHALVNSGRYTTVERSEAFLSQVAAEHVKQRSGQISDRQISKLGEQFGVDFVCIVEIVEYGEEKQVSARIVNVETVVIEATGLAIGRWKTGEELVKLSNEVVATMLSTGVAPTPPPAPVSTTTTPAPTPPPPTPTTTPAPVFNIEMVFVSGGTFTMGCTSEQGSDCDSDERPSHSVTLSSFSIGKFPVTQAQWIAVMGSNPSRFKGDNLPVEQVSWNDIVNNFIPKLNALTGKTYRLPTESEWEFAARGGNSSKRYKYSGSNSIGDVAWYGSNSGSTTRPVGTKQPNKLGIYDMSGNVWEWVGDWYGSYTSTAKTNPTGPSSGSNRVFRGGSWYFDAWYCRVSYRNYYTPDGRSYYLGFRLAVSP